MSPPSLPTEVVRLILDTDPLALPDIVRASHVSRIWRIAARSHPTYARDISLFIFEAGPLHGAVLFFLDRLAALPGGILDLKITVIYSDGPSCASIMHDMRTLVFPALTQVLPRVVTLSIKCNEDLIPDMLAALRLRDAPRLVMFKLYAPSEAFCPSPAMEVIPLDQFSGHAPLLRELQVDPCQFPAAHPVPAFASVRKFGRCVYHGPGDAGVFLLHPERVFVSCPVLEELSIHGCGLDLSPASWEDCPPPSVTNLRSLTLTCVDGGECTEVVLRTFAHAGMRSIKVDGTDVNAEAVELMISSLDGSDSLQLDIDGNEYELDCSLLDAQGERRRTFWHAESDVHGMGPETLLAPSFARIARRFTRVSVTGCEYAWNHLLGLFPEATLSSVQTLEITLCKASLVDFEPPHKLALPALAEIELFAKDVDADELLSFVNDMLDLPAGRRLRLVIADTCLSGDTSVLSSRFDVIGRSIP